MKRTMVIASIACATALLASGCQSPTISALFKAGVSEYQLGHLEAARQRLTQVLNRSPSHPGALFYMGRISHAEKRYEEAIYYYRCCLDADPAYPGVAELLLEARRQIRTGAGGPGG